VYRSKRGPRSRDRSRHTTRAAHTNAHRIPVRARARIVASHLDVCSPLAAPSVRARRGRVAERARVSRSASLSTSLSIDRSEWRRRWARRRIKSRPGSRHVPRSARTTRTSRRPSRSRRSRSRRRDGALRRDVVPSRDNRVRRFFVASSRLRLPFATPVALAASAARRTASCPRRRSSSARSRRRGRRSAPGANNRTEIRQLSDAAQLFVSDTRDEPFRQTPGSARSLANRVLPLRHHTNRAVRLKPRQRVHRFNPSQLEGNFRALALGKKDRGANATGLGAAPPAAAKSRFAAPREGGKSPASSPAWR